MNTIIGLKELRENMETYVKKIKQGKTIIVYRHSTPLFKVSPVENEQWEEVIDFTKIKRGGVNIDELLKRL